MELNTFKELQALERVAIRSRVEVTVYVILEGKISICQNKNLPF